MQVTHPKAVRVDFTATLSLDGQTIEGARPWSAFHHPPQDFERAWSAAVAPVVGAVG